MRRNKSALLTLVFIFLAVCGLGLFAFSAPAQAATYYVDGTNGNNNYDGTSHTYQGGNKGSKKTIAAGLALLGNSDDLQIREGVYYESKLKLNLGVNGTFNDRVTISNYNGEDVFLSSGHFISGPEDVSVWTNESERIYRDRAGSPKYYYLLWTHNTGSIEDYKDMRLGYYRPAGISVLDEEGEWATSYDPTQGSDHFFYTGQGKDMSDYRMMGYWVCENLVFDFADDHDYVTFDGLWFISSPGIIETTAASDYITIKNSYFYGIFRESHCGTHGIFLRGNNNLIENNVGRLTSSYFISGLRNSENFTIKNNKFSYNRGNTIHATGKNLKIQNNDFSHYAQSWYYVPGWSHAEGVIGHTPGSGYVENLLIENNYFHDADAAVNNPFGVDEQKWDEEVAEYYLDGSHGWIKGNDYGYPFYTACGARDQGDGFIYRYNVHEGKSIGFYFTAEGGGCDYRNMEIYGNVFSNINNDRTCEGCSVLGLSGMTLGPYYGTGVTNFENLKIYNNLFYNYRTGISLGARSGKVNFLGDSFIRNNIFYIQDGWTASDVSSAIYFDDSSEINGISADYNLYYRPDGNNLFAYRGCDGTGNCWGQLEKTLSQWRAERGYDQNSIEINPNLLNPQGRQYSLSSNSPAINAGLNLGSSHSNIDPIGNIRGLDGFWDIGAYEYNKSTSANPDVNSDTHVNIKDIQACIKVITRSNMTYQERCQVLAPPDLATNIKDIQVIIREIIK